MHAPLVVDCFDIGRQAYLSEDHYHTVLWMREALRRLDLQPALLSQDESTDMRADIFDHLAYSSYMVNDSTYDQGLIAWSRVYALFTPRSCFVYARIDCES